MDYRTDKQVERDRRNKAIVDLYVTLREQEPLRSRQELMRAVAREFSLNEMTIRNILIANQELN